MTQPTHADKTDVPPAPEEVLDEERIRYQSLTALDDDEYHRLAIDIREHGVLQPVIVDDSEAQVIIDGHHREAIAQYYDLPPEKKPAYVVLSGTDDTQKLTRAIKQNLIGRDTTDAVKRHAIKQYIETAWDRTDDDALVRTETDAEVADKLGVARQWVSQVVKNASACIIYHSRLKAREYYEANPDASYREVARQVDASHPTVAEWLKEDFDEGDDEDEDEQQSFAVTARNRDEAADAAEVTRTATDDGTPASDTAGEQAEKLAQGKTSPTTASKNVEQEVAEQAVEEQRQTESDTDDPPSVRRTDATALLNSTSDADLLLTDPPYTTDVDDVAAFARSWLPSALDVVGDDGLAFIFIGAYADELQAYLNVLDECGVRDRTQVLVWTYRNTLGQTPCDEYKRNWQTVLFIQSDPPTDIDAPLTSEQWAVQDINAPDGRHDGRHHKWEKPTDLIERFVRHTTTEGDRIVDPFVGTGTTAIVGHELGRDVVAGDASTEMLKIAAERGCIVDE